MRKSIDNKDFDMRNPHRKKDNAKKQKMPIGRQQEKQITVDTVDGVG